VAAHVTRLVPLAWIALCAVAAPAHGHLVRAKFGTDCTDQDPCDHAEGIHQVGVPGVDATYSYVFTDANSANGHLSVESGYSNLGGGTITLGFSEASIVEHISLHRIQPGPASLRASLLLEAGGEATNANVQMNGSLWFTGCHVFGYRSVYTGGSSDFEALTSDCSGEFEAHAEGELLVVTASFPAAGALPTNPTLEAHVATDHQYIGSPGTAQALSTGDLQVELTNLAPDWDTESFLTEVPEPETDALGATAIGALAATGRRRHRARGGESG
jgi:hypothetical protein